MARRHRRFSVFSLSFLDIMSCGFGATVLVFMIIHHATIERSDDINRELLIEVERVEQAIVTNEDYLREASEELGDSDAANVSLEQRVAQILEEIARARDELADFDQDTSARREDLDSLMTDVRELETEKHRLESIVEERSEAQAEALGFLGRGDRQYLTGLKLGGDRMLILLDGSGSMLDETIVNVIRLRNMSEERQRAATKWRRAVLTVEWLISRLPEDTSYQVYVFNEQTRPLVPGTEGQWFAATDSDRLKEVATLLGQLVPEKGTSLFHAMATVRGLDPLPDNVVLITDGLPTQGATVPRRGTVTARNRLRHFQEAINENLPLGVPVNTVLFPMEGDPAAASEYWKLAMVSGGSFMSPSDDWP